MEAIILLLLISACGFTCLGASSDVSTPNEITANQEYLSELQELKLAYEHTIEQQLALGDLMNSNRRKLIEKNSNYLAIMLCGSATIENQLRIHHQIMSLGYQFERAIAEAIIEGAISLAYHCSTFILNMRSLCDVLPEHDKNDFELIVIFYIHTYAVMSQSPASRAYNMQSWSTLAFSLYKLKQHKLYPSVAAAYMSQVDGIITNLPNNCQYLFFRPNFCLMNDEFNEYIYIGRASKSVDSTSRYVWGWHDKRYIDEDGPINATIFTDDANSTVATNTFVQLKGIANPLYYYVMAQTRLVAAWELPYEPVNSIWSIKFLDEDRVALYQQQHIACFTDEKYDDKRRILRVYEGSQYTSKSRACQWLLGICERK